MKLTSLISWDNLNYIVLINFHGVSAAFSLDEASIWELYTKISSLLLATLKSKEKRISRGWSEGMKFTPSLWSSKKPIPSTPIAVSECLSELDQVWSFWPALVLLNLDCSSCSRGSNSNSGKMDQTWFMSELTAQFFGTLRYSFYVNCQCSTKSSIIIFL